VQLADDALVEAHVHASELLAGRQLADGGLARPPALFDADVRVGKGPPHVGHVALVGAGRAHEVGVLPLSRPVARPKHVCAVSVPPGQWLELVLDRVDLSVVRIAMRWGVWVLSGHCQRALRDQRRRQGRAAAQNCYY